MQDQKGNALFLILIAVALFAALSYAITSTSRGGDGISREQSLIEATKLVDYANLLSNTIMRMRTVSGCSKTEINFENSYQVHPDFWGGSTNTSAPSDGSCDVFGNNGAYYLDNYDIVFTSIVGVDGIGSAGSDLIMWFKRTSPTKHDEDLCTALNDHMKLDGTYEAGSTRTLDWYYARGAGLTYVDAPTTQMVIGEDGGTAFSGKPIGCLQGNSTHDGDAKIFYFVLDAY